MIPQIKTEIKIMYGLHHPNIVKLFNHFEENDYIYLVIEFAEGGQLWDKLNKKGRFDEKTVQQIIREMVLALEYCHTREPKIIHRDIKPENILLDKEGHIKLADFGWSQFFNPGVKRKTYCGTLDYLAPEMITESGHDESLDYWSIGVLAFELLTGKAPFTPPPNVKDQKKMQEILEDNIQKVKLDWPKDFPSLAKDLVTKLLKKDPKQRLKINEIKAHPWIKLNTPTPGKSEEEKSSESPSKIDNSKGLFPTLTSTSKVDDTKPNQEKPENVKPKPIFNPDEFSADELKEYSSRSQSIINRDPDPNHKENPSSNDKSGASTPTKLNEVDKVIERFSISMNKQKGGEEDGSKMIIDDLNKTIKELRGEVSEM